MEGFFLSYQTEETELFAEWKSLPNGNSCRMEILAKWQRK
jgi:hypothetical protein